MPCYLGIDTSNYTTSLALYESAAGVVRQAGKPLPVGRGQIGLRQSDAVFSHIKQLDELARELLRGETIEAVGASSRPRDAEGSYMPCFLVGRMAAGMVSAALGVPMFSFSHQAGHIMAALYGSGRTELAEREFLAFHLSGGTTECLHVSPGGSIPFAIEILSQSADLYAGQLIDRVGAMLSLPFPAGPTLEKLAEGVPVKGANPAFRDGNPCLSGLQNQCGRLLDEGKGVHEVAAFCIASVGNAVERMTDDALKRYPGLPIVYAGGVMSNRIIRERIERKFEQVYFAPPTLSSDNAAGIALLTYLTHQREAPPCGC